MHIRPYGDTLNDGAVQLSFTLPVGESVKAREAARLFVLQLGFESCEIVHSEALSDGYTFFLAYGKTNVEIDYDKVDVHDGLSEDYMDFNEINDLIAKKIGRKIVVVGACTGSDAHTVCLDAIMNMKGFNHHYGLERYPMIESYNLGAQIPNKELIEFSKNVNADAILVSQVVTQKDIHIKNMTEFIELLNKKGCRDDFIVVVGGPKISHKLAIELGFDAGFGRGTHAEHVGTFIAKRIVENTKQMNSRNNMAMKFNHYRNSCPQTEPIYIEVLKRMGGEKRLKTAFGLYEMAINLCKQNIKEQNPGISAEELKNKISERFGYDTGRSADKSSK